MAPVGTYSKLELKRDGFEYMVSLLIEQAKTKEIDYTKFSKLSLLKLLFFVVGASCSEEKGGEGLTRMFDNFAAMPYGPVESDIYRAIQRGDLTYYKIGREGLEELCPEDAEKGKLRLEQKDKDELKKGVQRLMQNNGDILGYEAFDLVEISHMWSCWQQCYEEVLSGGGRSAFMPGILIRHSTKYYGK